MRISDKAINVALYALAAIAIALAIAAVVTLVMV